ncbi:MAG: protease modulator HflC [Anaerohalosphaeraceae bacterium]
MKNIWGVISIIVVVAALALAMCSFQVRQTETALVTRFGDPVRTITEPGFQFRWPIGIENVHKFDSRLQLLDVTLEETTTAGGEPIIVNSFIVWRIAEPQKYLVSVRDTKGAQSQLESLLRNAQNSVIGRHYFSDFVNTDPGKVRFEAIEGEILQEIAPRANGSYGIEVASVGIKRLKISEKTTEKVFERMKADRKRKTDNILAAGTSEAEKILSDAQAKQKELLAVAEAQAKAIRGAGDAEAAAYYKMLEADPELAMFLRDLEALRTILKERSTIVLGTDTEPMQLLKGIPDMKKTESK